jgi:hypothetical protein
VQLFDNPQIRRRMRLTVAGEIPTSAAICLPVWRCRRNTSTLAQVTASATVSRARDYWPMTNAEEFRKNAEAAEAKAALAHDNIFKHAYLEIARWRELAKEAEMPDRSERN